MRNNTRRMLLLAALAFCCSTTLAGQLSREALLRIVADNPDGAEINGKCEWAGGAAIDYTFDFTSKGNGWLSMGEQQIRVYDSHDDGCYYEGGVLNIDLVPAEGIPLVVLTGVVCWTSGKGGVIKREVVLLIFALNRAQRLEPVLENHAAKSVGMIRARKK